MVIQHAELEVQEKYYPKLVEAYRKDTLLFETLALLEDRINVRNNRFQYYGTQIINFRAKKFPYPLYNVDSLEYYRAELGFKLPYNNYMSMMNLQWNIAEYKLIIPELIAASHVTNKTPLHYKDQLNQ